jgi:hypothetical protein
VLDSYKNVEERIAEPFIKIKRIYECGLDLIRDHYIEEMAPEMKKLDTLKTFLEKSNLNNVKKHYNDKDFNDTLLKCVLPGK